MTTSPDTLAAAGATIELLSTSIRNACVNDGLTLLGDEVRNAETIALSTQAWVAVARDHLG